MTMKSQLTEAKTHNLMILAYTAIFSKVPDYAQEHTHFKKTYSTHFWVFDFGLL